VEIKPQIEIVGQIALENGNPEELGTITRQLVSDLKQFCTAVELGYADTHDEGTKSGELEMLGYIAVATTPTLLMKFLDFLHAWAMRREGRVIKIKYEDKDGKSLELEVAETTKREEIEKWINTIRDTLERRSTKNSK